MSQKQILIADDDRGILTALSVRLKSYGFDVLTAMDAYQALSLAQEHAPDLVILDVRMPAGEGTSVQERMQKLTSLATTPVIYLTGDKSPETAATARELGAFDIVYKPFQEQTLLSIIDRAIGLPEQKVA